MPPASSRIIVTGAGHGGLVAAMHLARAGCEVLVFERQQRDGLGWDWHDHLHLDTFERAGIDPPPVGTFYRRANVTFTSPDLKTILETSIPEQDREIGLERAVLIDMLLAAARGAGARVEFGKKVDGPLVENDHVTGIVSAGEPVSASLVIDSAGLHSPVREGLPPGLGIQQHVAGSDVFHAYRAYHELLDGTGEARGPDPSFITHFGFDRTRGIAWFQDHDLPGTMDRTGRPFADVLVGKIGPFVAGELDALLARLRHVHPSIGDRVLRGGHVVEIPVRRPLDLLVADGYALVGDAACMTNPVNGSGIEHAMIAGRILADVILAARTGGGVDGTPHRVAALWPYQVEYARQAGARMTGVHLVKEFLATAPWPDIDFIFKKRLITSADIEATTGGGTIRIGPVELLRRAMRGIRRPGALLRLKRMVDGVRDVTAIAGNLPRAWDPAARAAWQARLGARVREVVR